MQNQGTKHDVGKTRYDLIPVEGLAALARVYTMGAQKYDDNNWRKGIKFSRIYAAIQRHLSAFWSGENNDKESGLPHLAHSAWGCMTLIWYCIHRPGLDNRYREFGDGSKRKPVDRDAKGKFLLQLREFLEEEKAKDTKLPPGETPTGGGRWA